MSKTVKIKQGAGGLTAAHPSAEPGWTDPRRRVVAHFFVEGVPDDVSVPEVIARLNGTTTTATLDPNASPGEFVLRWEELGRGRIIHHRKRADLTDEIQEACIARMHALGLNPNRVAEQLDGKVSRAHVCDFLTRRASIGSHKLQHLLDALGLRIVPAAK